jgi:hypothetical protein
MVNQILTFDSLKKRYFFVVMTLLLSFVPLSVWASYDGSDRDSSAIIKYLNTNAELYFTDLNSITSSQKRRKIIELQKELERLALKIDAGDISNKKLRERVIAIKRNANNKSSDREFVLNDFSSLRATSRHGALVVEFAGIEDKISPWLKLSLSKKDNLVREKILQIDYDVLEGDASFSFSVKRRDYFKRYNSFVFSVKGDSATLQVAVIFKDGESMHKTFRVDSRSWMSVAIPFDTMNGYESFDFKNVRSIVLSVLSVESEYKKGTLFFDSFRLQKITIPKKNIPNSVQRYSVEGTVPLGENKSFFN